MTETSNTDALPNVDGQTDGSSAESQTGGEPTIGADQTGAPDASLSSGGEDPLPGGQSGSEGDDCPRHCPCGVLFVAAQTSILRATVTDYDSDIQVLSAAVEEVVRVPQDSGAVAPEVGELVGGVWEPACTRDRRLQLESGDSIVLAWRPDAAYCDRYDCDAGVEQMTGLRGRLDLVRQEDDRIVYEGGDAESERTLDVDQLPVLLDGNQCYDHFGGACGPED